MSKTTQLSFTVSTLGDNFIINHNNQYYNIYPNNYYLLIFKLCRHTGEFKHYYESQCYPASYFPVIFKGSDFMNIERLRSILDHEKDYIYDILSVSLIAYKSNKLKFIESLCKFSRDNTRREQITSPKKLNPLELIAFKEEICAYTGLKIWNSENWMTEIISAYCKSYDCEYEPYSISVGKTFYFTKRFIYNRGNSKQNILCELKSFIGDYAYDLIINLGLSEEFSEKFVGVLLESVPLYILSAPEDLTNKIKACAKEMLKNEAWTAYPTLDESSLRDLNSKF